MLYTVLNIIGILILVLFGRESTEQNFDKTIIKISFLLMNAYKKTTFYVNNRLLWGIFLGSPTVECQQQILLLWQPQTHIVTLFLLFIAAKSDLMNYMDDKASTLIFANQ